MIEVRTKQNSGPRGMDEKAMGRLPVPNSKVYAKQIGAIGIRDEERQGVEEGLRVIEERIPQSGVCM